MKGVTAAVCTFGITKPSKGGSLSANSRGRLVVPAHMLMIISISLKTENGNKRVSMI